MSGDASPDDSLRTSRDDALANAVDQITQQIACGERVDVEELCGRYPQVATQIRELLPIMSAVGQCARAASGDVALATVPPILPVEHAGVLGDFHILRELGRGGMGIVYEAQQVSLQRNVALKVLPYAALLKESQLRRFLNEARAAAMLKHPHIVSVHFVGCDRGVHFYAMELIQGQSLAQLLQAQCSKPTTDQMLVTSADTTPIAALTTQLVTDRKAYHRTVARLGAQAAAALHYAHEQGVVHRDIKPSNLLLDAGGVLYVTDFGLARIQSADEVTLSGQLLGTLRYMSPEQAAGHISIVDHRTDVYSLGATLYELLTQRPAMVADDRATLLHELINKEPVPPRDLVNSIPVDLQTIVLKAMSKSPQDRYATAQDLADDLQRFVEQRPIQARPLCGISRAWRWCRRSPAFAGLAAALFLLSLGMAAMATMFAFRESKHHQQARAETEEARWQQYLSDMHSAMAAWEQSNVGQVANLLERHVPQSSQQDYRGFEWYYLWKKCEQGRAELNIAHPCPVRAVAFSHDGKTIATGGHDGALRLWDSNDGSLRSILFVDSDRMDSVAFSPRDDSLAASGIDGTIRIFHSELRRELLCLTGHMGGVLDLRYATDGSEIVSESWDRTIRTWDARTGQLLATLPVRGGFVSAPENQQLWTYSLDNSDEVRLLNTHTGAILKTLRRPELKRSPFNRVGAAPSRMLGISGSHDGVVRFFRLNDGDDMYSEAVHQGLIYGIISTSADERFCATAGNDGRLVVWDLESLEVKSLFRGHAGAIRGTAFSPDGRRVASGGADGWLKVWNVDAPRESDVGHAHTGLTLAQALHPSGKWVVTGGESTDELMIWDTATGRLLYDLSAGHRNWISGLAFSPNGQELVSASDDGTLRLWDFEQRKFLREVQVSQRALDSVAFSRDGKEIATSDSDGWLYVYPRSAAQPRIRLQLSANHVSSVTFSPDGKQLAAAVDGTVVHLEYPACQRTYRFPGFLSDAETIDFSPDGQQIACGGREDTEIVVYSLVGASPIRLPNSTGTQGLAFSPDGKTLAVGGNDHHIRLWDLPTRDIRAVLHGHDRWVTDVRFSPQGNLLTSVSDDRTVRFWRAADDANGGDGGRGSLRLVRPPTSDMIANVRLPARWIPRPGPWAAGLDPLRDRLAKFPDDLFTVYQLAILQLHVGNRGQHQELVRRLLDHYEHNMSSTRLSNTGERIAIACVLDGTLPREHWERLRRLLERPAVRDAAQAISSEMSGWSRWGLLARGWTEYRLGDNKAAIASFTETLAQRIADRPLEAMAQFGLAAAQWKTSAADSAKQAANVGAQLMNEHRAWIERQTGDVQYAWQDWLAALIVQREIEQVLATGP